MKGDPETTLAMVLRGARQALQAERRPLPQPGPGQVRLRVRACAVCRTDLHLQDGDLLMARWPVVPGHEVVGAVDALGPGVTALRLGQRVGVPWLGGACGRCRYCLAGQENLCDAPEFTGCTLDGGFATHAVADARFCVPLDRLALDDASAAPLLCAGLIGWRSLRLAGDDARVLGLYGFGAAAHLIAQVAVALRAVRKGGRVVCGGIHMSDIPSFPYALLWQERQLRSVANLTRADAQEFFAALQTLPPLRVRTTPYPLQAAQQAMDDLRAGRFQGAAVLLPD